MTRRQHAVPGSDSAVAHRGRASNRRWSGAVGRATIGAARMHPAGGFVNVGTEPFRANVIHTNSQASTGCYPQRWTRRGPEPHRCGSSLGKSMWTDTKRHDFVHGLWTRVDFLLKVLGTTGR